MVYRDILPGNIFISYDENVKLIDFGISKNCKRNEIKNREKTKNCNWQISLYISETIKRYT
jgi:serine/threonine protein kinase